MDKEALVSIGNLVQLKKNAVLNRRFHPIPSEKLGYGIVLDKISQLFVFPEYIDILQIDFDKQYEYIKNGGEINIQDPVSTKLCKVFWFSIEKMKWEYESDLENI
jgi:hypothetical protein